MDWAAHRSFHLTGGLADEFMICASLICVTYILDPMILLYLGQDCAEFGFYPRDIQCEAGMHHGYDASTLFVHSDTHSHLRAT